jgi:hypothetical protein
LTSPEVVVTQYVDATALEDHVDVIVVAQHEVDVILAADRSQELGRTP